MKPGGTVGLMGNAVLYLASTNLSILSEKKIKYKKTTKKHESEHLFNVTSTRKPTRTFNEKHADAACGEEAATTQETLEGLFPTSLKLQNIWLVNDCDNKISKGIIPWQTRARLSFASTQPRAYVVCRAQTQGRIEKRTPSTQKRLRSG